MGKTKTREDEEDEADIMPDPESSISSEVEDPPSTSPQEQYSTATSSSKSGFIQAHETDPSILSLTFHHNSSIICRVSPLVRDQC